MISDLYARKKELIAKNRKTISDKVAIDNINRTINEYSDMLSNDELRLTTAVMLASERDEQGNLGRNNQDHLAKAYDDLFSGVDEKGFNLQMKLLFVTLKDLLKKMVFLKDLLSLIVLVTYLIKFKLLIII